MGWKRLLGEERGGTTTSTSTTTTIVPDASWCGSQVPRTWRLFLRRPASAPSKSFPYCRYRCSCFSLFFTISLSLFSSFYRSVLVSFIPRTLIRFLFLFIPFLSLSLSFSLYPQPRRLMYLEGCRGPSWMSMAIISSRNHEAFTNRGFLNCSGFAKFNLNILYNISLLPIYNVKMTDKIKM